MEHIELHPLDSIRKDAEAVEAPCPIQRPHFNLSWRTI